MIIIKRTSAYALVMVLSNREKIWQRQFVKTISSTSSAVLTQQPVLHKIWTMYSTCTIWNSLLAGSLSEQCRSPLKHPPLEVSWGFGVAQHVPQTLSRCLAGAEMFCCKHSALQVDHLTGCVYFSISSLGALTAVACHLHTSGSFPFLTQL